MSEDDKKELMETVNDYKDLVAKNVHQMGCTTNMQMSIELQNTKPVYHRPYRLSHHEREQLKDMVDDLKSADIIEGSASPFASPMLLVRKKK